LKNVTVSRILNEIADILEMKNVEYKPRAYRKAARSIGSLPKPIEEIYSENKLREISGVGKSIEEKIIEIIETGTCEYYEELKKELPVDVQGLTSIESIGPKTIKKLYKKLKIRTLDDLAKAAQEHKLRDIEGFGPKTEKNILEHLEFAKSSKGRMLLGYALPIAEEIKSRLMEESSIDEIELAGSLRRMNETIGDIDLLVTSDDPEEAANYFTSMNDVRKVLVKGKKKSSIILENGLHVDLRIISKKNFGSALMYFTGSKDHNIELRKRALNKGYKLSEYGLFKKRKQIAGKTEKSVYEKLNMSFIDPELRENRGEIEASIKNKLPKLIDYDDIKGDLQIHSKWSDGKRTIDDMAKAAIDLDYEYLCISDHYSKMKIAKGMNDRQIKKQMKEIENINKKLNNIHIFKGAEVDIEPNGKINVKKKY
jgi:DNA polymerase (family 10)